MSHGNDSENQNLSLIVPRRAPEPSVEEKERKKEYKRRQAARRRAIRKQSKTPAP
jgi:hypothetical protein